MSLIFFLLLSNIGLYKAVAMAEVTPNSARFKKPKTLITVVLNPMKSAPRWSIKILREKKDRNIDIT
ncbi:hypothetical protein [Bacteroides thetaiotaomicron]|uniref:hypothetical protein n=1 Tax=Bacteroides thetaiotaomicron TaxID=818 RepID=UPI00216229B6|nr:hypothetical protein [Bacteroides thetaiotaomicron]UVP55548.1 hypothetical protein NXX57_20325 [Bacteroides thetaiotaomicron]